MKIIKNKFYVSAIYTSPPNSMGGNTKILIEIINNLYDKYDFVVLTTEPKTFEINLVKPKKVKIVPIKYPYEKFNLLTHFKEIKYIEDTYNEYFKQNKISENDYFFSPSDFAPDVLPIFLLKKKYNFKWIPSLFLFIPNPIQNLFNHYKFPFFKYILYYFYQRFVFNKIKKKGDLFLITNEYDKKFFPKKLRKKILAIYGGVNLEQIEEAKRGLKNKNKLYDAVFCSRLHPQKGISQLLDVWKKVTEVIPTAKLVIMGNGEKKFEEFLKEKAKKLGIDNNINWFGFVNGAEKYKVYLQSKMFLHGTIYDNNGMVAAEALCSGISVIMYDLPQLKDIYRDGCTKIEIGNKNQYAQEIINKLKSYKTTKITNRNKIADVWDWQNRAKTFNAFLKRN
jgi:glycosyltransferase involved in cell wall biosynthesis